MSTIYKIELNLVSDWVKLSEEEVENFILKLFKTHSHNSLRITNTIIVKENK